MGRYLGAAAIVLASATCYTWADPAPWGIWQPPVVTYPNPNAYDTYLEAFVAMDKVNRAHGYSRENPQPAQEQKREGWWDEGPPNVPPQERVKLFAPVYDLVAQALTQPCRLPAPQSNDEWFPYYGDFRAVARLLAMRAHVAAAKGDYDGAASSALDGIALAQHVATSRWLLGYLVAVGCEATGRRALDEVIPHLDRAGCEKALRRLEAIDKTRVPLAEIIDGDEVFSRRCFKDLVAHPETVPEFFDEKMSPGAQALLVARMRAGSWQALDAFWVNLRAQLAEPYSQRQEIPEPTDPPHHRAAGHVQHLVPRRRGARRVGPLPGPARRALLSDRQAPPAGDAAGPCARLPRGYPDRSLLRQTAAGERGERRLRHLQRRP